MKFLNEKTGTKFIVAGIIIAAVSVVYFIVKRVAFNGVSAQNFLVSAEKAADFGGFIAGIVGVIWSLAGVILFYVSLRDQREDIKTNRQALRQRIDPNRPCPAP